MFSRIRAELEELKKADPGKRFRAMHEKQRELMPGWAAPLYIGGAIVSLGVGVVLMFIPGPAILFFALSGTLLATQSGWVADKLDVAEQWLRKVWGRLRKREDETPTKAETPQARAKQNERARPSTSPGAAG